MDRILLSSSHSITPNLSGSETALANSVISSFLSFASIKYSFILSITKMLSPNNNAKSLLPIKS